MFEEFTLPGFLLEAIDKMGWEQPTPVQSLVIPKALEGKDILGGAPTGTGKSAAFLLPVIARLAQRQRTGVQCIILEPTRELAIQVCEVAKELLAFQDEAIESGEGEISEPITVGTVIGGEDRSAQRETLPTIMCATPGRLQEFLRKNWFDSDDVELLVIDEADRMLDMGFRDDIASITRCLERRFQTMLFSATLEGFGVRDFARNVLNEPEEIVVGGGEENTEKLPELLQARAYYAANDSQKVKILQHLMTTIKGRTIIFVRTKETLSRLSSLFGRQGMSFASLKGESSQNERKAALRRFSDGEVDLLLATDVASRGLDIDDVAYVYNYDLPQQAEIYVHRAGRTARAGAKGTVISLVQADEIATLERIERYTDRTIERRSIKGLCDPFDEVSGSSNASEKKRGRASPNGGFEKKTKDEKKPRKKIRLRDKKNKGKPDFAAKRLKKAARLAAKGITSEDTQAVASGESKAPATKAEAKPAKPQSKGDTSAKAKSKSKGDSSSKDAAKGEAGAKVSKLKKLAHRKSVEQ